MSRSRRVVIDNSIEDGFENTGVAWHDRGAWMAYTGAPVRPEDDYLTVSIPVFHRGVHGAVTEVTIWGMGLITFGPVTAELRAHMATLSANTDVAAFLAALPGDYIAVGFQPGGYGQMEYGRGLQDSGYNPFNGGFYDPDDPFYSGPTPFEWNDARALGYVAWGDEPIEGDPPEGGYDGEEALPLFPDGTRTVVGFSDDGWQVGVAGATYRFGDDPVGTVGGNGRIFFSDWDHWTGSAGNDDHAATAPQTLDGGDGRDRLTGSDGGDRLLGGAGNDVLVGGGGVDRLDGGDGRDWLSDGDEAGTLHGGEGDDTLVAGRGDDTIDGGGGIDRLVIDASSAWRGIDYAVGGDGRFLFGDDVKTIAGVEVLTFAGGSGTDNITGGAGDDVLVQNGGGGTLDGRGGNDALTGGDGRDTLVGGVGRDVLAGGAADDHLTGGTGRDDLDGGGDNDALFGEGSDDVLAGGDGADRLDGGDGNDRLDGGSGRDSLFGGEGRDHLDGGSAGGPLVVQGGNGGNYSLNDEPEIDFRFAGDFWGTRLTITTTTDSEDVLLIGAMPYDEGGSPVFDYFVIVYDDAGDFVDARSLMDGGDYFSFYAPGTYVLEIQFARQSWGIGTPDLAVRWVGHPAPQRDEMHGGRGSDVFVVDHLDDRVVEHAGEGRDEIRTDLASYSLAGLAHVENLTGGSGAQVLIGNDAANVITGGGGLDSLSGGDGDDLLVIAGTPALVDGGAGRDTLHVVGTAALTQGMVVDVERVSVGAGGYLDLSALASAPGVVRTMLAAGDVATVIGSAGDDRINGSDGRDLLTGGDGQDAITGEAGDDVLAGGGGRDVLTGGSGADRFVFATLGDMNDAGGARDQIADFDGRDGDRVDLTGLGFAQDGMVFRGGDAFTGGGAAELRFVDQGSGRYVVEIDLHGDTQVDGSFVMVAGAAPVSTDVLF